MLLKDLRMMVPVFVLIAGVILAAEGAGPERSQAPGAPPSTVERGVDRTQVPAAPQGAVEQAPFPLGDHPLCEASAALVAPWDPAVVLVADNEDSSVLFAFRLRDGNLSGQRTIPVPAKGRPHDVESLTTDGSRLALVGSQSRSSRCAPKPDRQRIAFYRWDAARGRLVTDGSIDGSAAIAAARVDSNRCLKALFTSPPPPLADEFCRAFAAAEAAARAREGPCVTMNIEGSVALPSPGGGPARIWLGLRSPIAGGAAVLLRLTPSLKELRFDAVTFLDLGGRGVRELARRADELWGIAGKQEDSLEGFALWRLPLSSVAPGRRILVESFPRALPAGAEGLVFQDGKGIVVFDVDQIPGGGSCRSMQLPFSAGN